MRTGSRREYAAFVASTALVIGVLAGLAVLDMHMFEDAEFTPLYRSTLEQAYSRWKDSDARVPFRAAAPRPDDAEEMPPAVIADHQTPVTGPQSRRPPAVSPARRPATPAPPSPPGDGGPHALQGAEHLKGREYEAAVNELRLALAEHPQHQLSHHWLGDALHGLGRDEEAIVAYRRLLELNPEFVCCHVHIGDLEAARHNNEAARAAYDLAIDGYRAQLARGGRAATNARYYLAKLYCDRDRHLEEALVLAQQAVGEAGEDATHLQLLARLYGKLGRAQDALGTYDKLIEKDPTYAEYYRAQREALRSALPTADSQPATEDIHSE